MSRRLLLPQHRLHPQGFVCTEQNIQISDYQLYAVEKWLVDRSRQLTLLVVYTGDPTHRITLSAYSPDTTADSETVWDNAIALLRADGAKPKQTNHGVLMVTSLAHFRSDYTIVQIPDGNFLAVKDQLYANINLLRMGCSGRTALTLEDPSETTKERFISTYHLPETTIAHSKPLPTSSENLPLQSMAAQSQPQLQLPNEEPRKQQKSKSPQIGLGRPSINVIPPSASTPTWRSADRVPNHSTPSLPTRKDNHKLGKTKDRSTFVITVLELVKLVQAGLSIFGLFGSRDIPSSVSPNLVLDGLLCDDTVDGIRTWIASVGGPCVGLEPTERIADPTFISGLLSLVLSTRNKLACIGYSHILPRDPFLYPYAFSLAISSYLQSTSTPTSTQSSPSPSTVSASASSHQLGITQNQFSYPHLAYHAFASPHIGITHLGHGGGGGLLIPPAPPPTNVYSATAAAHANAYTNANTNASNATSIGGATPSPVPPSVVASPAILPLGAILTREIVEGISNAYDAKQKSESKRVRRVIKNKLGNTAGAGSASGNVNANGSANAAGNLGGIDSDGADGERESRERRNTISTEGITGNSNERSPSMAGHGHGHSMSLAGSGGGIGASGGQILTGIGTSLASGLGLAGAAAGYSSGIGDPSALTAATLDLAGFVGAVAVPASDGGHASRKEKKKQKSRERTKSRTESVDIGVGYAAYAKKEKDKDWLESRELRDGVVGGSVKALWSGRVVDVVRMREEWDVEGVGKLAGSLQRKEKEKRKRHTFGDSVSRAIASDGDGDESYKEGGVGMKSYDGRSTEEESDVLASGGSMRGNHAFGWGGRVRGKLGHWAGLTKRKHQSVDLSATSSVNSSLPGISSSLPNRSEKEVIPPVPPLPTLPKLIIGGSASAGNSTIGFGSLGSASSRRPNVSRRSTIGAPPLGGSGGGPGLSRAQSPTLPPLGYSAEPDDDDLLSSGQASPLSDYRPNPFTLSGDAGGTGSMTRLDEQTLSKLLLNPKRPMPPIRRLSQTARISSWADPFSARDLDGEQDDTADDSGPVTHGPRYRARRTRAIYEDAEEESDVSQFGPSLGWKRKEKARFHSLLSVVDGEGQTVEKQMYESEYTDEDEDEDEEQSEQRRRRTAKFDPRRRRSFHNLDAFRDLEVLSPERMKIDVDICGQCLIMWRREAHLRNVVNCVQLLSASLSQSNTGLREHYKSHIDDLDELSYRAQIISEMEDETHRTEKFSQATNTLSYESEQFDVGNLWQAASPSRHKVFELREKVFGTGGRKLAPGVNGAHGQFNRLQWTLDDKVRLVDYLGRTEDEEDEESRIARHGFIPADIGPEEVEDGDVVEHPGIKPMWLLRFFTSWGARWSAATITKVPNSAGVTGAKDEDATLKSPMSGSEVGSPAILSPVSDPPSATVSAVSIPALGGPRRRPVPMDVIPGSFN
ncbi:hypothetical protein CPB83DRAFT_844022 [Crepidotus variabilis]|uniref:STB6-like N-terminal domain-containing protein n=1 Tax=Crepidotus variabilis TaxID=179855 RepID=A0A9P6ESF0_9AGAR|nr:hypothetical protein CPB83DRAFT_844022 [Crepidotus variabilis]